MQYKRMLVFCGGLGAGPPCLRHCCVTQLMSLHRLTIAMGQFMGFVWLKLTTWRHS